MAYTALFLFSAHRLLISNSQLSLLTSTSNSFMFMFFADFLESWGATNVAGVIFDIGVG